VKETTVGQWLAELASAAPAPGGGAVAALHASAAAGLVEMVCNLTIGKPKYAEHEAIMIASRDRAARLRELAIQLAAEDADAFTSVTDAYQLPRGTEAEKTERRQRIQAALLAAADVPARTGELVGEVLRLAERIAPGGNVNVLSDVAVAASSARAALESCVVNIEVNRAALKDAAARARLAEPIAAFREDIDRAAGLVTTVLGRISG
jgi:methenyltetrahydrofolate cyclohydrolase